MKLSYFSSIFLCALTTPAFANQDLNNDGRFYIGVFGGAGSSNNLNASQYGTAFFSEIVSNGPYSINAFGQLDNPIASFFGAQVGYQTQGICLNSTQWTLGPAVELEGFSINKRSLNSTLINTTARFPYPEQEFTVSYPMKRTVFLANGVLSFNHPCVLVHPYIGLGIGNAIVRISNASATQGHPLEEGIEHYNANASNTTSTFAGQIKLGLNYDIKCVSLFAEYRWLYLANTHFTLGSTVYPTHVETSPWQIEIDSQRHNLGCVGIRFNW